MSNSKDKKKENNNIAEPVEVQEASVEKPLDRAKQESLKDETNKKQEEKSKPEEHLTVEAFLEEKKLSKHKKVGFMSFHIVQRTNRKSRKELKKMWESYSSQLVR